jgi:hypothetical protein
LNLFVGDESETFFGKLDAIVKIGGGDQSKKEIEVAKDMDIIVLNDIDSIEEAQEIINNFN